MRGLVRASEGLPRVDIPRILKSLLIGTFLLERDPPRIALQRVREYFVQDSHKAEPPVGTLGGRVPTCDKVLQANPYRVGREYLVRIRHKNSGNPVGFVGISS